MKAGYRDDNSNWWYLKEVVLFEKFIKRHTLEKKRILMKENIFKRIFTDF